MTLPAARTWVRHNQRETGTGGRAEVCLAIPTTSASALSRKLHAYWISSLSCGSRHVRSHAEGPIVEMTERSVGDVIVINLVGALTSNDAAELHESMSNLLARGHKKIVFDLHQLDYIDSLGVGELVACQLRAIKNGQSLRLANADSRVQDVLLVTQLITVFDAYNSLESALESF